MCLAVVFLVVLFLLIFVYILPPALPLLSFISVRIPPAFLVFVVPLSLFRCLVLRRRFRLKLGLFLLGGSKSFFNCLYSASGMRSAVSSYLLIIYFRSPFVGAGVVRHCVAGSPWTAAAKSMDGK